MPEAQSSAPQSSNPQVINPAINQTSKAPEKETKSSSISVLTITLIVTGGIIGFFVGGNLTIYFGQRGFLGDCGLACAYYMVYPVPVFAFLNVAAYRGIKSLSKGSKIFGYLSLFIVIFSIAFTALIVVVDAQERSEEIAAIPSKVDFQIYKPPENNPFSNLNESHVPIDENIELRCRGVEYSFYGSTDGYSLIELKADEKGCPDFSYTNQENYEKALAAAEGDTTFGNDKKSISRVVDGETILIITDDFTGKTVIWNIFGKKGKTFINIQIGSCELGSECEDKFVELYKSLEPIGS